ncbi:flagellar biosynthesis protein FlgB [Sphingomonas ginkgonis]|uniref:Flagellar biosynthesis protein FlgB n=2 Tax=Sphingomonas ginkgonis TaxID=2315330 RepID=A0A3R9WSE5_9SPHN|nr:flagellar biosynthesis protein FlgB [Sphingomonas ginkgonis]
MRHLSERQKVIAENVANSDTPGFEARTLGEPDFGALLDIRSGVAVQRPTVRVTSAMAALGATPSSTPTILDPDVSETKPDGNNVSLEDQLLRLGQVQADFAVLTNLYRKQMQLMKTALGRTGGS